MDMLAYTLVEYEDLEILANTFKNPSGRNQFIEKNIIKIARSRRIAFAMNANSSFKRSFRKKPLHYQYFDRRQIKTLRAARPVVDFDASDKFCLQVTPMGAMDFQDDIPSIPTDNFKDH